MRFVEGESYVIQPVQSPRQAVQQLRIVKSPKEIEAMRKTAEIGSKVCIYKVTIYAIWSYKKRSHKKRPVE